MFQDLMYLKGFYNEYGKNCTQIFETEKEYDVEKSPTEIIDICLRQLGSTFQGALKSSRAAHPGILMPPILVNPIFMIVLFPIRSAKRGDTMWFNPDQIHRTYKSIFRKNSTDVHLKNGLLITVKCKLSSFNNKMQIADQYRKLIMEAGKNPTLIL